MTDITIDDAIAYFDGSAFKTGTRLLDAWSVIRAHLAKAADYERAVTEQAMLTECVSVTGRDPSDVIRDVIQWHVSNAAQPARDYKAEMKNFHRSLCDRFGYAHDEIDWFRDQVSLEEFIARRFDAALAHPRPTGEQAEEVAWTKKAAEFIEKKAQSYADEFGRDDMGSISFGAGRGADKMEEYWMSLIDLAEDFLKLGEKCQVPPDGWECSRAVGHDGPCAASPAAEPDGEVG